MTDPGHLERDDDALAAEYAVGVLPHGERASFARRLEQEPELRRKVRAWDEHLIQLASEFAPITPPGEIFSRIENALFHGTQQGASIWASLSFLRALSIAALVAVTVMAGLLTWSIQTRNPSISEPILIAELSSQDGAVKMLAVYNSLSGELKFNITAGTPAPNRDFELWLIEANSAPVSLGVVSLTGTPAVPLADSLKTKLPTAVLAISDEPKGGSPTGLPTGEVLATGKVMAL